MAHSRVSRFPGLADAPTNGKLWRIWLEYTAYCFSCGVEPADYNQWRQLTDNSYKLAGI